MIRRCGSLMITTLGSVAAGLLAGACGGEELVVSATLPSTSVEVTVAPTTTLGSAADLFTTTTVVLSEAGTGLATTVAEVIATEATNPCTGDARLPGEALEFSDVEADLDGDGLPDRLTTYGIPMTDGPMRWRARLEPAAGGFSEAELEAAFGTVGPIGSVQVDRNVSAGVGPADEVLIGFGDGTILSAHVLTVDELGCLVVMGDGLGAPVTLEVGAGDGRSAGLRCESTDGADYLVQLEAIDAGDGVSFTTTDTRLQRIGTNLVPFTVTEGSASVSGDVLPRYSMLDCTGVTLPIRP